MARADGYFTEYYSNVPDYASATAVNVSDPNNTPNINFTLAQCGSISGTVTSDNGTADLFGTYHAFRQRYARDGGRDLDDRYQQCLQDRSRFAVGSYLIRIEADGYFGEYYNNVTDIDLATR